MLSGQIYKKDVKMQLRTITFTPAVSKSQSIKDEKGEHTHGKHRDD